MKKKILINQITTKSIVLQIYVQIYFQTNLEISHLLQESFHIENKILPPLHRKCDTSQEGWLEQLGVCADQWDPEKTRSRLSLHHVQVPPHLSWGLPSTGQTAHTNFLASPSEQWQILHMLPRIWKRGEPHVYWYYFSIWGSKFWIFKNIFPCTNLFYQKFHNQ